MKLLAMFVALLVVGSGALSVAWANLEEARDGPLIDSVAGLAASAIAAISLVLLSRIVYRVSRSTRHRGS